MIELQIEGIGGSKSRHFVVTLTRCYDHTKMLLRNLPHTTKIPYPSRFVKWLGYIVAVVFIVVGVVANCSANTPTVSQRAILSFCFVSFQRTSHCAMNAQSYTQLVPKILFSCIPLNFWLLRSYYWIGLTYKRYHVSHTQKQHV